MFIAKISISFFTVIATFIIIEHQVGLNSLSNPLLPAFVILVISYIVASIFVSVFDAASNTMLQCYLIDAEMDARVRQDNHIPAQLRSFLRSVTIVKDKKKQK